MDSFTLERSILCDEYIEPFCSFVRRMIHLPSYTNLRHYFSLGGLQAPGFTREDDDDDSVPLRITRSAHKDSYGPVDTAPWLLLPHESGCKQLSFFDVTKGELRTVQVPKEAQGGYCCGSSRGWLFIARQTLLTSEIILFNPISGARHQLPPLKQIPFFNSTCFKLRDPYNISSCLKKSILSSEDPSQCTVALCLDTFPVLALCKVGDTRWSVYHPDEFTCIRDIAFFDESLLYVITSTDTNVASCTIKSQDCETVLRFISDSTIGVKQVNNNNSDEDDFEAVHLVVSPGGDKLFITNDIGEGEKIDVYALSDPGNDNAHGGGFHITKVDDFGDDDHAALFSTEDDCIFVKGAREPIQKNCIYFVSDEYSLEERPLEFEVYLTNIVRTEPPPFPVIKSPVQSRICWFMPGTTVVQQVQGTREHAEQTR